MREYHFDHVHLRCSDPDGTARFFETMFGATAKRDVYPPGTLYPGQMRVSLVAGGQKILIAPAHPHDPMTPAPAFPFPRSLKLLRGQVIGSSGPIADAEVSQPNIECVVTDRKGCYALPLRQVPNGKPVEINATDHRTRRVGHITIVLPDALGRSQPITIR